MYDRHIFCVKITQTDTVALHNLLTIVTNCTTFMKYDVGLINFKLKSKLVRSSYIFLN